MKTEEEIRERIKLTEDLLENNVDHAGGNVEGTFLRRLSDDTSKETSVLHWVLSD